MRFFAITTALALLLSAPVAHSQELVACDLVGTAAAVSALEGELSRHTPSRSIQKLGDGSTISDCLFFVRKDRARLHVKLITYPSAMAAAKSFSEGAISTEIVNHTPVPSLGDAATWWSIGAEAYGFTIRKGSRVLVLDTRWHDATRAGLRERLTPLASAAVGKL